MMITGLVCFVAAVISGLIGLLAENIPAERAGRTLFGLFLFVGVIFFIVGIMRRTRAGEAE